MKRKKLAFEVEQKISFQLALVVTISFSLATILWLSLMQVMTLSLSLSLSLSCGIICLKEDATLKQKKSWTKKFGGMMKFVICHLLLFLSLSLSYLIISSPKCVSLKIRKQRRRNTQNKTWKQSFVPYLSVTNM